MKSRKLEAFFMADAPEDYPQDPDSPLLAPTDSSAAARSRHHRGRPHGVLNGEQLNAQGFFDTEFRMERKPGGRRIAALADSFGVGVVPLKENFLTLLEESLNRSGATEVLNFGISGSNPPEYLHLYRVEAKAYDPDLVLLCFFIGNAAAAAALAEWLGSSGV